MAIVIAMLKIVAALALGYFLNKIRIIDSKSGAAMSKLIIFATSPCLTFASIVSMGSERKDEAVMLLWLGVVIYVFLTVIAFVTVKLIRVPKESFATYMCVLIFGNVGFIGFPLAQSLYGSLGLFYIGILNIHFTLFAYTFGMVLMTGASGGKIKFSVKTLINPGTVSVVLALILFLLDVKLPDIVLEPISFIGQITSPLAMIVLGSTLAGYSLKTVFSNWRNYIVSIVRLLVMPAIAFLIMNAIWGVSELTTCVTLYVGCPTATILVMMSLAYGGDVENSSASIGLTTVLSIITIPVLWFFVQAVGA